MSVTFSGLSAGIIFKLLVTAAWERKATVAERLRLIAEMNHHIRNGLEIISLSAYTAKDKTTVETMKYGVEKIEWALREVLPKLPQSGSL
jgi:phospholipid N-methyltransferase